MNGNERTLQPGRRGPTSLPPLTSPSYLTEELKERGLHPRKRMGQHFLVDDNILQKIISAAEFDRGDRVIDIGSGPGALSLALAKRAAGVIAVEWDRGLAAFLRDQARQRGVSNLRVVEGDVRRLDLERLCREVWGEKHLAGKSLKVVANLPYYLTTPLLFQLLQGSLHIELSVLMIQLEVARRILAEPGSKDYGLLSVLCQFYTEPKFLFKVSKKVFYPPPEVDSAVVLLRRLPVPSVSVLDEESFFQVVRAAFLKRRKTLLNALEGLGGLGKRDWENILAGAGISPKLRGESLSLEEFAKISDMFYNIKGVFRSNRNNL